MKLVFFLFFTLAGVSASLMGENAPASAQATGSLCSISWKKQNIYTLYRSNPSQESEVVQVSCYTPFAKGLTASYLGHDEKWNIVITGVQGASPHDLTICRIPFPEKQLQKYASQNVGQDQTGMLECFHFGSSYLSSDWRFRPFFQLFNRTLMIDPSASFVFYQKRVSVIGLEDEIVSIHSISGTERNGRLAVTYSRVSSNNRERPTDGLGFLEIDSGKIREIFSQSSQTSTGGLSGCSVEWLSDDYIVAVYPSRRHGALYRIFSLQGDSTRELACDLDLLMDEGKLYGLEIQGEEVKVYLLFEADSYKYDKEMKAFYAY
ncbi:MAG: hypothetical protein RR506_09745 [Akkermansia sp.]